MMGAKEDWVSQFSKFFQRLAIKNFHNLFTKFSVLPANFVPGNIYNTFNNIFGWLEDSDSITILPNRREEQSVEVQTWCEDGRLN